MALIKSTFASRRRLRISMSFLSFVKAVDGLPNRKALAIGFLSAIPTLENLDWRGSCSRGRRVPHPRRSLGVHTGRRVDDFAGDDYRRWYFHPLSLDLDGRAIGHLENGAADSHSDVKLSATARHHSSHHVKVPKLERVYAPRCAPSRH